MLSHEARREEEEAVSGEEGVSSSSAKVSFPKGVHRLPALDLGNVTKTGETDVYIATRIRILHQREGQAPYEGRISCNGRYLKITSF
jgi:hypothetical protein